MVRMFRMAVVAVVMTLVAALALPGGAAGQAGQPVTLESYAGAWEGTAQTPNGDVSLRATFRIQDGRLGGVIQSSMGPIPVVASAFADGKLTMTIDFQGGSGTLGCRLQSDRMRASGRSAATAGPSRSPAPGQGVSPMPAMRSSGTWAGEVDIAGQLMPFSMELRLSGEAVAGDMTSAAGKVPLASGSWKDGALQLGFRTPAANR